MKAEQAKQLAEIREFGESIIMLDQMPGAIAVHALANTCATTVFNVKHRTDVNAMSQAMMFQDDEKSILGILQIGEAVVRLLFTYKAVYTVLLQPSGPHCPTRAGTLSSARQTSYLQSGRRDSNAQHSAWKADALPLSYTRKVINHYSIGIYDFVRPQHKPYGKPIFSPIFSLSFPAVQDPNRDPVPLQEGSPARHRTTPGIYAHWKRTLRRLHAKDIKLKELRICRWSRF